MVWGGRREEGSGCGTHVYLWQIHFDIWQNQYNIVKLNKIKFKNIYFSKNKTKQNNEMNFKILLHTLIQQVFFECPFCAGPYIDSRGVLTIYYFKKEWLL